MQDQLRLPPQMRGQSYSATAAYDSMISQWFAFADQQQLFPDMLEVNGNRVTELRYGENPHQRAALVFANRSAWFRHRAG